MIKSVPFVFSFNPFNTSHRAKLGAKSAKLRVDILMSNHYHVIATLETVQPPMFAWAFQASCLQSHSCHQVAAEDIQSQK